MTFSAAVCGICWHKRITSSTIRDSLPSILGASFALGFASVAPQLMVPFAADLVSGPGRGKVVGTVMSGLLIGILLSRTLSGLIGSKFGALVAPLAGQLGETWAPRHVNGLFFSLIMLAFVVMLFAGQNTLITLGIGVLLLDAGTQGSQIANRGRIYTLNPALHGRLNSICLVSYFIAGSLGSLVGAQAWAIGGWNGVCATGILFSIAAIVFLWR
jgi:hypothetical protein